ncbi:MAG TPA: tetratricopeptide repeat protein [Bacteroidia bacterium]|nr:tetratricopeptide repeat protein [Bacteroidia bacterium]
MKKAFHFSFVILLLFIHPGIRAQSSADTALLRLKALKDDSNKVKALNAACWKLVTAGKYDDAFMYADAGRMVAEKINFKKGNSTSQSMLGIICDCKSDPKNALDHYFKAMILKKELNDSAGLAGLYNNVGFTYQNQGNYPLAIENYFDALRIYDRLKAKTNSATTFGNIATVYWYQADFARSIQYEDSAMKIRESISDSEGIASCLTGIGLVYKSEGDSAKVESDTVMMHRMYSEALDHFYRSIALRRKIGKGDKAGSEENDVGSVYWALGQYDSSLAHYGRALDLFDVSGSKSQIAMTKANIGSVYQRMGQPQKALGFASEALALALSSGYSEGIKESEKTLSDVYESMNEPGLAFPHYKNYVHLRDSLVNVENRKTSIRSELTFEYDKKAALIEAEKEKQKEISDAKEQRQELITWVVVAGLILVLIFSVFILRGYREKKKANAIITEQKSEVEKQKHVVEEKQKEILDSITYAKRIQDAQLPNEHIIHKNIERLKKEIS